MKLHRFLIAAVCFTAVLTVHARTQAAEATQRPNVVFFLTDDQSWDTVAALGGKVHTPALDRLAKEGLLFTNANTVSTVCSPSRYAMLTGRYPSRCYDPGFLKRYPEGTQVEYVNDVELEHDGTNVAAVLQKAGYRTGLVGKFHLTAHDVFNRNAWEKNGLQGYAQDADPRDPAINAKMRHNHQYWCDRIKAFGFDYVNGAYIANMRELFNDALNVHNLENTTDRAIQFIENANAEDKPFYLYLATTVHHGPFAWIKRKGKYPYSLDADIRMSAEGYLDEAPNVMPPRGTVIERVRAAGIAPEDENLAAAALWLDDSVQAVMDKLEALGIADNTLFVFTADHGLYKHGKTTLYDNGMKIPLIMRWPSGIQSPGRTYEHLTSSIDYVPTILEACGVAKPDHMAIDGISLMPILRGTQAAVRQNVFAELGYGRAIKTDDWKYIAIRYPQHIQDKIDRGEKFPGLEWRTKKKIQLDRPYMIRHLPLGATALHYYPKNYYATDQLYNLSQDPEEQDNVFAQNPEVAHGLQQTMRQEVQTLENRPFGEFSA